MDEMGEGNRGSIERECDMRTKRLMKTLLALVSLLPVAAVSSDTRIVAFGDSTTATRGELKIYADILQSEFPEKGVKAEVINAGVGGHNTDHAKARFEKDVLAKDPDIVIIQFGINDAAVDVWKDPPAKASRVSLENYEKNLRHFVKVLTEKRVKVILMTPNPLRWTSKMREMYGKAPYLPEDADGFNVKLKDYAAKVREIAKSQKIPIIDIYAAFEDFGKKDGQAVDDLLLDGIHPNAKGHRLVADRLLELISKDKPSPRAAVPPEKKEPRTHPGQWSAHENASMITDLSVCTPASALSDRRHHDKWKIFEYETADFKGKCVSVGRESSAPDLTLNLDQKGWHAVYIGLSTITDLVRPAKNQLEAKFTNDPAYTRLSNRLGLGAGRRDVLEEIFLGIADLSDNDLQFSTVYEMPARIHYVKTIPLSAEEIKAVQADRKQTDTRTSVATFDGYTWIHPFRPQGREDLAATFSAYRNSDFKTWWFQVGGADLVHHPTKVGNLMGGHLDTFPRLVDREYVESIRHLHSKGIDPVKVAVEEAHAQNAEILICLRAAGWKAAPPWEEFFMSDFYEQHPEWRCIDHDGTPTMHMSYAAEEVQDHLVEVYREVLQRNPDGVGFMFHRGLPTMLWEEPFCNRFQAKFGEDPRKLDENDPRVYEMRAEIMTGFMRKIRALLDEVGGAKDIPGQRLKFAVTTFSTEADNKKFGLDVETWIKEKLVDQIGIAWFAYYTSGLKTKTGDTAYYARITEGTDVKIYPFYVGWKLSNGPDLLKKVARDYEQGADGVAFWDPNQFAGWASGKAPYWPLVSRLGHREQVKNGALLFEPVQTPLTRMGENHYSRWYPNTGF